MTQKELKNLELLLAGLQDIKNDAESVLNDIAPKNEGEGETATAHNAAVVGNKLTSLIIDIKKSIENKQLVISNEW